MNGQRCQALFGLLFLSNIKNISGGMFESAKQFLYCLSYHYQDQITLNGHWCNFKSGTMTAAAALDETSAI